jgi:PBP1b-binding outer membrane lipoprotein LpoB
MNTLKRFTALGLAVALLVGCSAETKEEAKEALKETTEAASSAAKDTKANVKKAAEVFDAGVDSAREKAEEIRRESPAGDSPDDADTTPEAEEQPAR